MDDLLSGGQNVQQARLRKEVAKEIMSDASFVLHKWHSNEPQLEDRPQSTPHEEQSYAKQQLQAQSSKSKLLGVKWNKEDDTIAVQLPETSDKPTKRGVLAKLAKVYDPLGLASPTTLQGKQIFREICDSKASWDSTIPDVLRMQFQRWEESLPAEVTTSRPIAPYHEATDGLELYAFGDASTYGIGAAVYSVVHQRRGVTQTVVTARARLAKKDMTIPRLELVSAHMAANLVTNVRNALQDLPEPTVYGWLDSTVALHWILGNGQYRQFVANRVRKIREHPEIRWRHVPTLDHPADLAGRGGQVTNAVLWWNGSTWLSDPRKWPENLVTAKSPASEEEAKASKEVLNLVQGKPSQDHNEFDELLERNDLRRTLRVHAWVRRFTTHR